MKRYQRAGVAAWAVLGLLLGHTIAYAATFRDPQVLLHVLEDTGHNWLALLPVFVTLAVALLALGTRRKQRGINAPPLRHDRRLAAECVHSG